MGCNESKPDAISHRPRRCSVPPADDVYADATKWADSVDARIEREKRGQATPSGSAGPGAAPFNRSINRSPNSHSLNSASAENSRSNVSSRRAMLLPDNHGGLVAVTADANPFVRVSAMKSGEGPLVAAPILVRADGDGDDEAEAEGEEEEGGGLDVIGRLRPLDPKKYVLVHIPSAVYPNARNTHPPASADGAPNADNATFVPLAMPGYEDADIREAMMARQAQ